MTVSQYHLVVGLKTLADECKKEFIAFEVTEMLINGSLALILDEQDSLDHIKE